MEEIKAVREQLSASFLDAYLRFQKLNEELNHSAGTIVWKGPKKQYPYWQFYDHGKQILKNTLGYFKDIEKDNLNADSMM